MITEKISYDKVPYGEQAMFEEDGKWIAIDNRDGNAWVESFDTKNEAIEYLNGACGPINYVKPSDKPNREVGEDGHEANSFDEVLKVLTDNENIIKSLKKGESRTVVCPLCGSAGMTISKSGHNGHLHIWCNGCEFLLVQ